MSTRKPRATHEQAVLRIAGQRALIQARQVAAAGIPTVALTRLVQRGALIRAGRGIYSLPGRDGSAHTSLAEVALRAPRGVICLLTALRVHEIGTQAPFEVWLSLPKGAAAPRIKSPAVRVVRMTGGSLTEGIVRLSIEGVSVPVYDLAKTVADCFKFRNKVGLDVALEALRDAWHERKVTSDALWRYAKINRVANVMRPYLESLT